MEQQNAFFPKTFELLSRTINFYRENFKKIFGILLFPLIFFILFLLAGLAATAFSFAFGYGFAGVVLLVVLVIAALAASIWSQASLFYFYNSPDKSLGVLEYYKLSKPRVLPYFITSILVGIIVFFGFLLLVIPGIIFFVRYSLAAILSVVEDVEATEALKKSKSYIEGNWGKVAGRLFGVFFLLFALFIILAIVVSAIFGEDSVTGGLIYNLISILAAPIASIYLFEIYKYLKTIKASPENKEGEANTNA